MVFVTHSVYESAYMSSRVVVMATHPGRVASEHADVAACRAQRCDTRDAELPRRMPRSVRRAGRAMESDLA